jgi:Ca2+-binding EF-hand superfamily protein
MQDAFKDVSGINAKSEKITAPVFKTEGAFEAYKVTKADGTSLYIEKIGTSANWEGIAVYAGGSSTPSLVVSLTGSSYATTNNALPGAINSNIVFVTDSFGHRTVSGTSVDSNVDLSAVESSLKANGASDIHRTENYISYVEPVGPGKPTRLKVIFKSGADMSSFEYLSANGETASIGIVQRDSIENVMRRTINAELASNNPNPRLVSYLGLNTRTLLESEAIPTILGMFGSTRQQAIDRAVKYISFELENRDPIAASILLHEIGFVDDNFVPTVSSIYMNDLVSDVLESARGFVEQEKPKLDMTVQILSLMAEDLKNNPFANSQDAFTRAAQSTCGSSCDPALIRLIYTDYLDLKTISQSQDSTLTDQQIALRLLSQKQGLLDVMNKISINLQEDSNVNFEQFLRLYSVFNNYGRTLFTEDEAEREDSRRDYESEEAVPSSLVLGFNTRLGSAAAYAETASAGNRMLTADEVDELHAASLAATELVLGKGGLVDTANVNTLTELPNQEAGMREAVSFIAGKNSPGATSVFVFELSKNFLKRANTDPEQAHELGNELIVAMSSSLQEYFNDKDVVLFRGPSGQLIAVGEVSPTELNKALPEIRENALSYLSSPLESFGLSKDGIIYSVPIMAGQSFVSFDSGESKENAKNLLVAGLMQAGISVETAKSIEFKWTNGLSLSAEEITIVGSALSGTGFAALDSAIIELRTYGKITEGMDETALAGFNQQYHNYIPSETRVDTLFDMGEQEQTLIDALNTFNTAAGKIYSATRSEPITSAEAAELIEAKSKLVSAINDYYEMARRPSRFRYNYNDYKAGTHVEILNYLAGTAYMNSELRSGKTMRVASGDLDFLGTKFKNTRVEGADTDYASFFDNLAVSLKEYENTHTGVSIKIIMQGSGDEFNLVLEGADNAQAIEIVNRAKESIELTGSQQTPFERINRITGVPYGSGGVTATIAYSTDVDETGNTVFEPVSSSEQLQAVLHRTDALLALRKYVSSKNTAGGYLTYGEAISVLANLRTYLDKVQQNAKDGVITPDDKKILAEVYNVLKYNFEVFEAAAGEEMRAFETNGWPSADLPNVYDLNALSEFAQTPYSYDKFKSGTGIFTMRAYVDLLFYQTTGKFMDAQLEQARREEAAQKDELKFRDTPVGVESEVFANTIKKGIFTENPSGMIELSNDPDATDEQANELVESAELVTKNQKFIRTVQSETKPQAQTNIIEGVFDTVVSEAAKGYGDGYETSPIFEEFAAAAAQQRQAVSEEIAKPIENNPELEYFRLNLVTFLKGQFGKVQSVINIEKINEAYKASALTGDTKPLADAFNELGISVTGASVRNFMPQMQGGLTLDLLQKQAQQIISDLNNPAAAEARIRDQIANTPISTKIYSNGNVIELKNARKILPIGDLHGEYDKFEAFLVSQNVIKIDANGNVVWTAPPGTVLVFTGDYVDRGPKSKETLDLIIKMKADAKSAGSEVVTLGGNHDSMALDAANTPLSALQLRAILDNFDDSLGYPSGALKLEMWRDLGVPQAWTTLLGNGGDATIASFGGIIEFLDAMKPGSEYRKFFESLQLTAKVDNHLFMHSANPMLASAADLTELDTFLSDPDLAYKFVWYRSDSDNINQLNDDDKSEIKLFIDRIGVDFVYMGHTPTSTGSVEQDDFIFHIDGGLAYKNDKGAFIVIDPSAANLIQTVRTQRDGDYVKISNGEIMADYYSISEFMRSDQGYRYDELARLRQANDEFLAAALMQRAVLSQTDAQDERQTMMAILTNDIAWLDDIDNPIVLTDVNQLAQVLQALSDKYPGGFDPTMRQSFENYIGDHVKNTEKENVIVEHYLAAFDSLNNRIISINNLRTRLENVQAISPQAEAFLKKVNADARQKSLMNKILGYPDLNRDLTLLDVGVLREMSSEDIKSELSKIRPAYPANKIVSIEITEPNMQSYPALSPRGAVLFADTMLNQLLLGIYGTDSDKASQLLSGIKRDQRTPVREAMEKLIRFYAGEKTIFKQAEFVSLSDADLQTKIVDYLKFTKEQRAAALAGIRATISRNLGIQNVEMTPSTALSITNPAISQIGAWYNDVRQFNSNIAFLDAMIRQSQSRPGIGVNPDANAEITFSGETLRRNLLEIKYNNPSYGLTSAQIDAIVKAFDDGRLRLNVAENIGQYLLNSELLNIMLAEAPVELSIADKIRQGTTVQADGSVKVSNEIARQLLIERGFISEDALAAKVELITDEDDQCRKGSIICNLNVPTGTMPTAEQSAAYEVSVEDAVIKIEEAGRQTVEVAPILPEVPSLPDISMDDVIEFTDKYEAFKETWAETVESNRLLGMVMSREGREVRRSEVRGISIAKANLPSILTTPIQAGASLTQGSLSAVGYGARNTIYQRADPTNPDMQMAVIELDLKGIPADQINDYVGNEQEVRVLQEMPAERIVHVYVNGELWWTNPAYEGGNDPFAEPVPIVTAQKGEPGYVYNGEDSSYKIEELIPATTTLENMLSKFSVVGEHSGIMVVSDTNINKKYMLKTAITEEFISVLSSSVGSVAKPLINNAERSKFASLLMARLGINAPEIKIDIVDGQKVILVEFIENSDTLDSVIEDNGGTEGLETIASQVRDSLVADVLLRSFDLHEGNYLVSENDKVWRIDLDESLSNFYYGTQEFKLAPFVQKGESVEKFRSAIQKVQAITTGELKNMLEEAGFSAPDVLAQKIKAEADSLDSAVSAYLNQNQLFFLKEQVLFEQAVVSGTEERPDVLVPAEIGT